MSASVTQSDIAFAAVGVSALAIIAPIISTMLGGRSAKRLALDQWLRGQQIEVFVAISAWLRELTTWQHSMRQIAMLKAAPPGFAAAFEPIATPEEPPRLDNDVFDGLLILSSGTGSNILTLNRLANELYGAVLVSTHQPSDNLLTAAILRIKLDMSTVLGVKVPRERFRGLRRRGRVARSWFRWMRRPCQVVARPIRNLDRRLFH